MEFFRGKARWGTMKEKLAARWGGGREHLEQRERKMGVPAGKRSRQEQRERERMEVL